MTKTSIELLKSRIKLYTKFKDTWIDKDNIVMAERIISQYMYMINKMQQIEGEV